MVNTVAHSNGVIDTQTLDPSKVARPLAISAALGGTTLWSSGNYAYDGAGNVTRTGGGYYFYDGVGRLREGKVFLGPEGAAGGFKIQRPSYDAFGNIQTLSLQIGNTTPVPRDVATTSSTNRLSAGTYDAAGNLIAASDQTFEYDAFNQARRITMAGQDWLHFYTADDERVWSYQLGGSPFNRWTLRDLGGKVLREAVSDNAGWRVERDYIYRGGSLLASDTPAPLSARHFHLDHLGTPRAVSDVNGARVAYHLYLPFGEEASAFDQDAERKKFTGHERDAHSTSDATDDLDYMMARHHSPVTGRFLSFDPVGGNARRPQSWNRYAYVLGNPVKYTDPRGLVEACGAYRFCDSVSVVASALNDTDLSGFNSFISASSFFHGGFGFSLLPRSTPRSGVATFGGSRTTTIADLARAAAQGDEFAAILLQDATAGGEWGGLELGLTMVLLPGPFDEGLFAAFSAGRVTFGHGARHLVGTGLTKEVVEAAIVKQVASQAAKASSTGSFFGRVSIGGRVVEYRAYTLSNGVINIGTHYLVP